MLFVLVKNDRYLILTAQLYDAKEMAADAKTKGDRAAQKMAQDRIRIIQQGDPCWPFPGLRDFSSSDWRRTFVLFRNEATGGPPHV